MLESQAMRKRSGVSGVSQSLNMMMQKPQDRLNIRNEYLDENMNRVAVANVQQINDNAYYFRNNRWIDSKLVEKESQIKPARIVEFGTDEFFELAHKLARQNRQASISMPGDILLMVDGEAVLVRNTR